MAHIDASLPRRGTVFPRPAGTWWRVLASAALVGSALVLSAPASGADVADVNAWMSNPLHVVGGPVTADAMVLVDAVTSAHKLQLSAIDSLGQVAWSAPFDQSGITAGEAFSPAVVGAVVLDAAPVGSQSDPLVYLEGRNVLTGAVTWRQSTPVVIADAPDACDGDRYFCLTESDFATSRLVELDATSGRVVHTVAGIQRNMGDLAPGTSNTVQLWQSDASTPSFVETSSNARVVWRRSVRELFASIGVSPNQGWDFLVAKGLIVGSVGTVPRGGVYDLASTQTVAISTATGDVAWRRPGMFQCLGSLAILDADVSCVFKGLVGSNGSLAHLTLTLEGLDPTTGATLWTQAVANVSTLVTAKGLAFVDGHHLVVETAAHHWVVLDTRNGATTPATSAGVYWCESLTTFAVVPLAGVAHTNERTGAPRFSGCDDQGRSLNRTPQYERSLDLDQVGVVARHFFVWASPIALNGVRTDVPSTSVS